MNFFRERALSAAAQDLIQFDADSIRRVVSARHGREPEIWLVDPDAYEQNGRLLRDYESARMLAYSRGEQTLYATDGCNSCARALDDQLQASSPALVRQFAEANEIRPELLERVVALARQS